MKLIWNDKSIGETNQINKRGNGGPIYGSLPTGQNRDEGIGSMENTQQPVVTIDDLETLAEKLLADIRKIKTYKYPLGIRRGVKEL